MSIKATIIIITYNQESTIARAIESVLKQECTYPYEILIADDCSTDSTRAICEDYARRYPERIRLMSKMPNRGLVGNYFDAYDVARGEYIGDCAGDDEWLNSDRLRRSIEALDSDKSASAVFTDVEIMENGSARLASEDDTKNMYMHPKVKGEDILVGVLGADRGLPYTLSAALYRRESLDRVYGKYPEMVRCPEAGVEDVPVIAALATQGNALYIPFAGYRYYVYEGSVSNNAKDYEKSFRFYLRVLALVAKLTEFYSVDKKRLRGFFNKKISFLASQMRHSKHPEFKAELDAVREQWGFPYPMRARVHMGLMRLRVY